MPRSSGHKSGKHSSRDAKDYYSDSDKDSSFKEKEKEKDRDRKTKDSGSGDKRKLDSKDTSRDLFGSSGNCEHSSEYGSSKRRKERADDGVSERRSGGAGEDDSRAEKTSKASSESKSRRREDVEGDEYKKSRSEGKHRESNKKEERKSREGKSEKLPDDEERRTSKQAAEITDVDVKNQLRSPESHSQLEKRSRRRRDNSGDGHRHQEENGDTLDRHLLSKNEIAKDEKSKDEKYKDEKYKDDYWEATDREERYRDEIYRDERSARDRSDGRSTEKHSRDEGDAKEVHRKSKTQDGDREHGHDRDRGRDRQREIDLDRDRVHESDRDVNRHDRDYDRHRDHDHYRDHDRSRDEDWWEARIQQNPLAATLRAKRILNLVDMERMFAPVPDLSGFGWSPQMGGNPRIPNLNGDSADSYVEDVVDTETQEPIEEPIHHVPNGGMHRRDRPEGTSVGFPRRSAQNSGVFHAAGPSHVHPVRISHEDPRSGRKSSERKRKSGKRDRTEMLSKICDYLTTGRKEEWADLAQAFSDPNDMGLVMKTVAELPGVSYGDPFWMAACDFFMENEKAVAVFLRGCGGLGEVQLQWLHHQLQKRGGGGI